MSGKLSEAEMRDLDVRVAEDSVRALERYLSKLTDDKRRTEQDLQRARARLQRLRRRALSDPLTSKEGK